MSIYIEENFITTNSCDLIKLYICANRVVLPPICVDECIKSFISIPYYQVLCTCSFISDCFRNRNNADLRVFLLDASEAPAASCNKDFEHYSSLMPNVHFVPQSESLKNMHYELDLSSVY